MDDRLDNRAEVREFLSSRRARLSPQDAGLIAYGGNRRVKGLRREEVAMLAGVSVDYYIRLERGNLSGASQAVLEALSRALQLDDAEHEHLYDLARAADPGSGTSGASGVPRVSQSRRSRAAGQRVRPSIQRILDAMMDVPADVRNNRRDILASNKLGRALYSEMYADAVAGPRACQPANLARFMFLSPRARAFFPDWDRTANDLVAALRTEAGRAPGDRDLSDLIGELSVRSKEFRARWAAHNVRHHYTGVKRLHHPVVGDLELTFEVLPLPADDGLVLAVYTAESASPSDDALKLLASWAATQARSPIS